VELPVLIERVPEGDRSTARLGEPFSLMVEATTPEEAQERLREALRCRLQQVAELRSITVSPGATPGPNGGRLPQDDLTREWLQAVRQFREECDAADRSRTESAAQDESAS
jgi:hypothetical protein